MITCHFEENNNATAIKASLTLNDEMLCLDYSGVQRTLCSVNPWKEAGTDNIPGCVLRDCADELTVQTVSQTSAASS